MNIADKVAAKVNAQTEDDAIAVYTGLRIAHANARKEGLHKESAGLMKVMAMAGNALEARIGEERFDALLDQIDAQIYG
jgi:hypothetical protein